MKYAVALVLVCSVAVSAKHSNPPPTSGISLAPSAWAVRYSTGVRLSALSGGMQGWFFTFPGSTGSVNYVTTKYTTPLREGSNVVMTVQIIATGGSPEFLPTPDENGGSCGTATVRPYFEQQVGKHIPDATYAGPTYRWWANPTAVVLGPGTATVVVPVGPDEWSDADGHFGTDPAVGSGWADALAHPAMIGMTFGGCFFGHGVQVVGGTAQFVLTSYAVQ